MSENAEATQERYMGLAASSVLEVAQVANETGRIVEFLEYHDGSFHALLVIPDSQLGADFDPRFSGLRNGSNEDTPEGF